MGEMADFENERHMDECDDLLDYMYGDMDDEEAYDRGILDDLGRLPHGSAQDLIP